MKITDDIVAEFEMAYNHADSAEQSLRPGHVRSVQAGLELQRAQAALIKGIVKLAIANTDNGVE